MAQRAASDPNLKFACLKRAGAVRISDPLHWSSSKLLDNEVNHAGALPTRSLRGNPYMPKRGS